MKLSWRPAAEMDRGAIFEYVYAANRQAAVDLDGAFDYHTDRLIDFPESGRPGRVHDTRELVVPGSPYILVYRLSLSEVVILRIFHGAQRWPKRIT